MPPPSRFNYRFAFVKVGERPGYYRRAKGKPATASSRCAGIYHEPRRRRAMTALRLLLGSFSRRVSSS